MQTRASKVLLTIALVAMMALVACSEKKHSSAHDVVRSVALEAYQHLVEGDVDAYLASVHDLDSMPEAFRNELRDAFLQYMQNEQDRHGGISEVRVLGDTILDTLRADAFLQLLYCDSTVEQISVPLIYTTRGWKLK